MADDVLVMYAGRAVEYGTDARRSSPTRRCPTPGACSPASRTSTGDTDARLIPIPGNPPSLLNPPTGCAFHPRCAHTRQGARRPVPDRRCPSCVPGDRGETTSSAATWPTRTTIYADRGPARRSRPTWSSRPTTGAELIADEPAAVDPDEAVEPARTSTVTPDADADVDPATQPGGDRRRRAAPRGRQPHEVLPGEVRRASIRRTVGHVQAVDGVSFQVPRGRLARPGGRVRLRQVDDRSADHPALRPDRGRDRRSRARDIAKLSTRGR